MSVIKFHVDGLPPKKDGANSMWGKRLEAERLVKLRTAALTAMEGQPPLKRDVGLTITVCVGAENNRSIGDLDTFITGVCDGLMKAAARCRPLPDVWDKVEEAIRPDKSIAIEDDCQVISIQAVKVKDATGRQFYGVELEGD
jgi:hypothetical protein